MHRAERAGVGEHGVSLKALVVPVQAAAHAHSLLAFLSAWPPYPPTCARPREDTPGMRTRTRGLYTGGGGWGRTKADLVLSCAQGARLFASQSASVLILVGAALQHACHALRETAAICTHHWLSRDRSTCRGRDNGPLLMRHAGRQLQSRRGTERGAAQRAHPWLLLLAAADCWRGR